MKKSLLKVLASMLVLAMAITALVIPNADAKASDLTELVIVLPETETRVAKVLLDFDWNGGGLVADGTADSSVGWGRDMYTFTKDSSANIYRIDVTGTVDASNVGGTGATMQFLFIDSTGAMVEAVKFPLWDTKMDNVNAFINNDALYFSVSVSGSASWAEVTASTQDPTAASASDVMEVIDAIGTVELSDDCKAKIEAAKAAYGSYSGDASDITNYATLTAAEAEWNRLMAAGAGELTLHVQTSWTNVYLYGWDGADLGSWSGTAMTADANNDGWYTITTTLTQAANLIINNSSAQTPDWKYVSADEYWVTIASDNSFTSSTTAPTGWLTEEPGSSESPSESETPSESESESQTPSESESESQAPSESEEKSDYTPVYTAATIAGDFSALTNANITTAWDVAAGAADMTHLGNGIYVYELTFDATTEEVTVNYKVAFNNTWDVAIGYDYDAKEFTTAGGSANLYITIPAGTTSVKIYADENGLVAYNTIQNPDEAASLVAIAKKGDMNMVGIYMLLFAGAALVTVGAISKKKFA